MPLPPPTLNLTAVYFPGVDAYFKLTEDLKSNTRLRWGGTCLFQHPGWQHVFWDMQSAQALVQRVRVLYNASPVVRGACAKQNRCA